MIRSVMEVKTAKCHRQPLLDVLVGLQVCAAPP